MATFVYSIYAGSGKRIVTEAVAGKRVGPMLKRMSESLMSHGPDVHLRLRCVRLGERMISDPVRLNSMSALFTVATEHYINETLALKENLRKVASDPRRLKRLGEMLKAVRENDAAKETLPLPDLETGDTLLVGKFKNRRAEITGFEKDENNQPIAKTTKGDQKIFKPRIPKLMSSPVN